MNFIRTSHISSVLTNSHSVPVSPPPNTPHPSQLNPVTSGAPLSSLMLHVFYSPSSCVVWLSCKAVGLTWAFHLLLWASPPLSPWLCLHSGAFHTLRLSTLRTQNSSSPVCAYPQSISPFPYPNALSPASSNKSPSSIKEKIWSYDVQVRENIQNLSFCVWVMSLNTSLSSLCI